MRSFAHSSSNASLTSAERAPNEWIGPALADRLIDDHPLRDRWLPDRLRADDARQFVVAPLGFTADRRHLVDDHARQLQVGVVRIPHLVDRIGDGADPSQPQRCGFDDDQRQVSGDQAARS